MLHYYIPISQMLRECTSVIRYEYIVCFPNETVDEA